LRSGNKADEGPVSAAIEIKRILERLGYHTPSLDDSYEDALMIILTALRDMERELRALRAQVAPQ
jgi:phage shock protein A